MKKSIILLAFAFGTTGAFAQDLTSKKGEPILPEAEDWSIGIDAVPFLNYAGNFFGKQNANVAPTWNFMNSGVNVITGRYMTDAQNAYRGSVRLGFGGNTQRAMVANRMVTAPSGTANGFPNQTPAQVENTWKHSATNIGLSAGIEKRKGKTRLQGYYGGEAGINVAMSKDKFTYGNALAVNLTPTGAGQNQSVDVDATADNFSTAGNITSVAGMSALGVNGVQGGGARVTERKNGTTFGFGVRGFIGAEYFVLPKISLGGEFGWGLGISSTGATSTKYEMTGNDGGSANDAIGTVEVKGSKNGGWGIDTDYKNSIWGPSGSLRLNMYF